ncbi:MAG: hypothetical protein HY934_11155 [Candidatus Firestonebacteria bacterium]|nr:hypothetical protein [Candidatus Firestonebacteria bacterium]
MINYIPIILLLLPIVGAILTWTCKKEDKISGAISLSITAFVLIFAFYMYREVITESKIIISYLPVFIYGLGLSIDGLSALFVLITSFIWFLSTVFAQKYMDHEHNKRRYYIFSLLTLSSNLGVLMGKDLFTIFVFFELLGMFSYMLIIHTEKEDALFAGKKYLCMTIIGGLSLLFGTFLYFKLTGTMDIYAYVNPSDSTLYKSITAIALITGFGVKAGMIPLHIWLPDAHPAAPTPASSILSGVMIKAGAYGIIRVIQLSLFNSPKQMFSTYMGYTIIWIGIVTMFVGVTLALLQSNAKRLLAYHSISQMGYILMGIGCALYLGNKGGIGITGSVYHIINHALFKASLFFAAGAVFLQMHDYNLYNLGGLYRKMPLLTIFTIVAACGIGGVPLFNGYISKTILHHAILESYHLKNDVWLKAAEIIFVITSTGTACSFIKFTGLTFFGTPFASHEPQVLNQELRKNVSEPSFLLNLPSAILAVIIISLGIFPQYFLNYSILPILKEYYRPEMLTFIKHLTFWDSHNLSGVIIPIFGGFAVFFAGMKFGLFHLHIPSFIGFDFWYHKLAQTGENTIFKGYNIYKKFEINFNESISNFYYNNIKTIYLQYIAFTFEIKESLSDFYYDNLKTIYLQYIAFTFEIKESLSDFYYNNLKTIYFQYIAFTYEIKDIINSQYQFACAGIADFPQKIFSPSSQVHLPSFADIIILYKNLCIYYNQKIDELIQYFYILFKKTECMVLELDMKKIELYEHIKLKTGYFILQRWAIPIIKNYYPEADMKNINDIGHNLESLFDLKEKINKMRILHNSPNEYSFLEVESILEEKSKALFKGREIYLKATQRMLQYYTSDISFGVFLIIIIISIYFFLVVFKI